MFLDDECFKMCVKIKFDTPESVHEFYSSICTKFEYYYQARIFPHSTYREVKLVLDRTFNLWDSMVNKLLISNDSKLNLIGELFKMNSFKKKFMENIELREIYNKL